MCGICGELAMAAGDRVHVEDILTMREALVHRGPDSSGVYLSPDGRAGLGFRRLRIVDLSANADQPMTNEDGAVRIVFNGEIYNFLEIRRGLEQRGHQFRSRSDTEVIVHLYEEQGADCIAELDGQFAIAIWDERQRRLTLARDRAGKKPLFLYQARARIAFASEIKAFLQHPAIPIEIDPQAIPYYFLHGYVPCPGTFYRNVTQVEPGSVVTIALDGSIAVRRYWKLRYPQASEVKKVGRAEAAGRVRELMTDAVKRRLISDVPIGAFLSGGVDSTIVVGLMSRHMNEPVKTFNIGFKGDSQYDETRYARMAAERFKTEHVEFVVEPSAFGLVEKLVWHHDGPFGDASAIPTFIVSELTRRHVTVVLNGDGGDEVFAGYYRFNAAVMAEKIPRFAGRALAAAMSGLPAGASSRGIASRASRFVKAMNLPLYERLTRWSSVFYDELDALLDPDFRRSVKPVDHLRYIERDLPDLEGLSPLSKVLSMNFTTYLRDDLLVKADRCTMANSLEARSPFLDLALMEYVATLPDDLKIKGTATKVVLKEAFPDLLPPEIANRGKMGFGVPLGTWFRGELREYVSDLLLSADAKSRDYLSLDGVRDVLRRHQAGEADLGLQLWSLLCFEVWLRLLPTWTGAKTTAGSAA